MSAPSSATLAATASSSMSTFETPRVSSSAILIRASPPSLSLPRGFHAGRIDDAGHGHDLVAPDDERPLLTLGARDLCVDKHVLDLLRAADESVARTPRSYLKPWERRRNSPGSTAHFAVERDRRALEPQAVVLANRLDPAAEVDALRGCGVRKQLGERGRQRVALFERAQQVLVGCGMDPAEERQDLVADQPSDGARVRRVFAKRQAVLRAVAARLASPDAEKGADDTVLTLGLDSFRGAARDEAVEDRLDLVREGVAGCSKTIGREAVADPPELVFGASARPVDDVGAEVLAAEACVVVGLRTAQVVVHVQCRDGVAELA